MTSTIPMFEEIPDTPPPPMCVVCGRRGGDFLFFRPDGSEVTLHPRCEATYNGDDDEEPEP